MIFPGEKSSAGSGILDAANDFLQSKKSCGRRDRKSCFAATLPRP
jgi:hypothetical protein